MQQVFQVSRRLLLTLACTLVMVSSIVAGDIRHDRSDSLYTALAQQPQFNGIGRVNFFEPSAGVLVSRNWLLTAGHLSNIASVKFGNGGADDISYAVTASIAAPGFTGNLLDGHDMRLIRINGDPIADGKASVIFPLYSGPILDQVITNVGYGDTGNGVTGFVPGTFGTRRAGNMVPRSYLTETSLNLTRSTATSIMIADFIDPRDGISTILSAINGSTTTVSAQDLEYMIAGRDSGSPALINDGGVWKVAGTSSFIASFGPNDPTGVYGELSAFSVLDQATVNWIQATIAVPEPSTMALLSLIGVGGAGYGWHRSRRQRNNRQRWVK